MKNPHASGAVDISRFPLLEDKTIIDQTKKALSELKSTRVVKHVTEKKDGQTVGDTDFEVIFLAPDKVYFFGDDNVTGKRMEIFQLEGMEYSSFDGEKWTTKKQPLPKHPFLPEVISGMLNQGRDFRVVSKDRAEDTYKSCTVLVFERPSQTYGGQKEQVVIFIDNATKQTVRLELLGNERKPVTFLEEYLRFFDHNSDSLRIDLPAKAKNMQ